MSVNPTDKKTVVNFIQHMTPVVNQQFQLISTATDVQLAGQLYDSLQFFCAIKYAKIVSVCPFFSKKVQIILNYVLKQSVFFA